jgi:hypothetical protein
MYDGFNNRIEWRPACLDEWSERARASVVGVRAEPMTGDGHLVRFDLYEAIKKHLAPDPRRDWILV